MHRPDDAYALIEMRFLLGVGVALAALLFGGCAEPDRVQVECVPIPTQGYSCSLQHVTGENVVESCWSVRVSCANGKKTSARTCQQAQPGAKVSRLIPLAEFLGHAECDTIISTAVEDVDVRAL